MAIKDRASLVAQAETDLPDNTTRSITPEKLRNIAKDLSDSCVNRTTDSGVLYPKVHTTTVNLEEGENEVTHNLGKKARIVVFMENGLRSDYLWERDEEDELNKIIIHAAEAVEGVEINILAYS